MFTIEMSTDLLYISALVQDIYYIDVLLLFRLCILVYSVPKRVDFSQYHVSSLCDCLLDTKTGTILVF